MLVFASISIRRSTRAVRWTCCENEILSLFAVLLKIWLSLLRWTTGLGFFPSEGLNALTLAMFWSWFKDKANTEVLAISNCLPPYKWMSKSWDIAIFWTDGLIAFLWPAEMPENVEILPMFARHSGNEFSDLSALTCSCLFSTSIINYCSGS